jgi:hypothetical protein
VENVAQLAIEKAFSEPTAPQLRWEQFLGSGTMQSRKTTA